MMKRLRRWLSLLSLVIISCVGLLGWTQTAVAMDLNFKPITTIAAKTTSPTEIKLCIESQEKIDLNNANLIAFTDCPGFYPTLAQLIVNNGPYQKVEDVLKIPDLSDRQQQLLKANLDKFKLAEPIVPLEQRMPPR